MLPSAVKVTQAIATLRAIPTGSSLTSTNIISWQESSKVPLFPTKGRRSTDTSFQTCNVSKYLTIWKKYLRCRVTLQHNSMTPKKMRGIYKIYTGEGMTTSHVKRYFSHRSIRLSSLLVEPRRPADAPISSGDGKPMLQIWGLGTLSRSQTSIPIPKPAQSWYDFHLPPFVPVSFTESLSVITDSVAYIRVGASVVLEKNIPCHSTCLVSTPSHLLKSYNTCHRPIHILPSPASQISAISRIWYYSLLICTDHQNVISCHVEPWNPFLGVSWNHRLLNISRQISMSFFWN